MKFTIGQRVYEHSIREMGTIVSIRDDSNGRAIITIFRDSDGGLQLCREEEISLVERLVHVNQEER